MSANSAVVFLWNSYHGRLPVYTVATLCCSWMEHPGWLPDLTDLEGANASTDAVV